MFWYDRNSFVCSKQWNGTDINESSFAPQNGHIQLKQAFLGFEAFSLVFDKNLHLRSKTWLSERRITQKVIFPQIIWKVANPEERFLFDENDLFCSNLLDGTNITENTFAPHNEPPTAKLSFSGVLKHFCWKLK